MSKKRSKAMENVLFEIKKEVLDNFQDKEFGIKIRKKATKKKELLAITIPFDNPAFTFFINNKLTSTFFYDSGIRKWKEIV
jgi:hypothetical protein